MRVSIIRARNGGIQSSLANVKHDVHLLSGGERARRYLNRCLKTGRNPLHRFSLADDLIDMIAIDAMNRAHLKADQQRLDVSQDHRTQTFWTDVGLDRYATWVKQDLQRGHDTHLLFLAGALSRHSVAGNCHLDATTQQRLHARC